MAVTTTTRLGITRWSDGGDSFNRSQMDTSHAQIESLAAIYGQGLLSARPTAGTQGRFFFATDNSNLYYDNGIAWQTVSFSSDSPTFTGNVTLPSTTTIGTVSPTEIGYLDGVSSAIQTQLDTKATLSGAETLSNKILKSPEEECTISGSGAGSGGVVNYDLINQAVLYYTGNSTANFDINFRGDSSNTLSTILNVSDSISAALLITNGSTAYGLDTLNTIKIDGTSVGVTLKWLGGIVPTANANSIDVYTVVIFRTGTSTYTVLASKSIFS